VSLIGLAVEIHLVMYSYIIPKGSLKLPPEEYFGSLYSCTTIRDEMGPESCKAMAAYIGEVAATIRDRGDELIYTPPTRLYGWLNLTVSRPKREDMFARDDPFLDLRYLTSTP
jgi:hypothetical protein